MPASQEEGWIVSNKYVERDIPFLNTQISISMNCLKVKFSSTFFIHF